VPLVSSVTRRGSHRNITSARVLPVGELLLLRLKSRGGLLISPRDPDKVLKDLSGKGLKETPFSLEEIRNYVVPADPEKLGRSHRRWRTYMIVNMAVLLILAALFVFRDPLIALLPGSLQENGVIQWISRPGTAEPAPSAPEEPVKRETAAFIDEDSFVFGVPLDELTTEQREGESSFSLIMDRGVPELLRILETEGAIPLKEDTWERSVTISQFLNAHGSLSFVEDREWNGLIHRFYLIEMERLKETVQALAEDF
jgi:hypothetical protein